MRRLLAVLAIAAVSIGGCAGPILANPPAQRPAATPAPEATPFDANDPQPVTLPRDDAPHDRLTEWWYYTGHLTDEEGGRWGFEYVIFRAERGGFPVSWASHLALTDEAAGRFHYTQRSEVGPQVDRSSGETFDLTLSGDEPGATAWTMRGSGGRDGLAARTLPAETSTSISLGLDLQTRPVSSVALHDGDGWIDFGPAGGSYYYSRTRLAADGSVTLDGVEHRVDGIAWFDHQWGDFIAVGGGGWDWFAVNLDDHTDLTFSLVRDGSGGYPLVYGTLVEPGGTVRHLDAESFRITVTDRWRSPTTGGDYPAGWRIEVPGEGLAIDLRPTVADQELDTRATTGVVYWEGSQHVDAIRDGVSLRGAAYVELTGYGPAGG